MILRGNRLQAARSEALELALRIVEEHLDDDAAGRRLLRRLVAGSVVHRLVVVELRDDAELDVILAAQASIGKSSTAPWRK